MSSIKLRRGAAKAASAILLTAAFAGITAAPSGAGPSSASQTYIVMYKRNASPADAGATVTRAGGTLVANWRAIGVVVARSSDANFAATLQADSRVQGVASTTGLGVKAPLSDADQGPLPGSAPATDADNLSGLQWDMVQIHTPQAHAITGGSPEVIVGDVDTGLDFTHPDLAPNYDAANSTDCSSGTPQPLLPGNDVNGHGTHTAGTIAAASNGTGIVGVAPNVKIAGIKSSNNDGFFFPEMVICSYMWVASHDIDVTNNSYFADPWLFNCANDAEQRLIWQAERRAIRHAQSEGDGRRRLRGQRVAPTSRTRRSTSSVPTSRPAASRNGRSPTPAESCRSRCLGWLA